MVTSAVPQASAEGGETYVSFDVDAIATYVFGAVSPTEVMGASRIIEQAGDAADDVAKRYGGTAVFIGGGSGLLRVPQQVAAKVAAQVTTQVEQLTAGAATATAVTTPASGDFAACWATLTDEMSRAKRERGFRRALARLIPAGVPPWEVCESCGTEPASQQITLAAGTARRVGKQCEARRQAARDFVDLAGQRVRVTRELDELFAGEPHEILATVYLDADGLGSRLRGVTTATFLRQFAADLRRGVQQSVLETVRQLGLAGRAVLPVVGGDDVVVICAGRRGLEVVRTLWEQLDQHLASLGNAPVPDGGKQLRFSAGLAFGPMRAPLRIHFETARSALKSAKQTSRQAGEAHVEIRSFASLVGHDVEGPLCGGPLPRTGVPPFRTLLDALARVPGAQIAGLRRDLSEPSAALRSLALEYRGARNPAVAAVVQRAAGVATASTQSAYSDDDHIHDVLRGALALVPVIAAASEVPS